MDGRKQDPHRGKKGFAGLSDMVSGVEDSDGRSAHHQPSYSESTSSSAEDRRPHTPPGTSEPVAPDHSTGPSRTGGGLAYGWVLFGAVVLILVVFAIASEPPPTSNTGPRSTPVVNPDEVATTYAPELGVDLDRMDTRPGGLRYEDVRDGTGEVAEPGRVVVVHYTGWLPDGTQFDSSRDRGEPFRVVIGQGHVILGWDEGIPGMREGGQRRLVIPHGMAYGAASSGPIPARATLIFDVELLELR